MNDRYLFKAKGYQTDEWYVGLLVYIKDGYCHLRTKSGVRVCWAGTLCQCTGLKDKNGTMIWENDLVLTPKEGGYSLICWNDTEARWEMHNETEGIVLDFDNYWSNEIEVVGNQLDNPELF